MPEPRDSCVEPAGGPIGVPEEQTLTSQIRDQLISEEVIMTAQVGKAAPDFEAVAFVDGGFKNLKLSDYKGQWVVLCFYPGDFTFV